MKKKMFAVLLILGLVVITLSTSYSAPQPKIKGEWYATGRTSTGQSYTGTVNVKEWWGTVWVYGRYNLPGDEKLFSFFTMANYSGNTLKFDFEVSDIPGAASILSGLLRENGEVRSGNKVKIQATYQLSGDGNTFQGGWKAGNGSLSGKDIWTKDKKKISVVSLSPNAVESGNDNEVILTISGSNFPERGEIKPEEVVFLLGDKPDEKLQVKEILEVDDLGTTLKVKVAVAKDAATGERDVKVQEGLGKKLLKITRPSKKLPLGGSVEVMAGDTLRVYIPNSEGGALKISGIEKLILRKGSETGEEVKANDKGEYDITANGWYYLDLSQSTPGANVSVSSTYTIFAEVPEAKRPWNFWYYPFVESYSNGRNLYKDGELYSKLDKFFGLTPEKDGWKKFDPQEHMDWWASKYTREQIFKKIYEANPDQDWNKLNELREKLLDIQKKLPNITDPEEKKKLTKEFNDGRDEYWKTIEEYKKSFKMDGLTDEEKKLYNPTTIQGYGWCYLRSKDSDKGWWGHCWGAVVASSLWARPGEAMTVKGASGEDIQFTQEDLEGILVDYYTNHSVYPTNYMSECPPGPPKQDKNEGCDSYADDFWVGLMTGIKKDGLPLAINIRESYVSANGGTQVWNQVSWRFKAEIKELEGDETYVEIKMEVGYSKDTYPSNEGDYGTKNYTIALKYNADGSLDRDNMKFQNWISAAAYCPSYLWRIQKSTSPMKTDNALLRGRLDKLVETFKFKPIE